MLVLLAGIFVVHIATVIMLFVSTIANVSIYKDIDPTVQAFMILSIIFCVIALLVFVFQLFTMEKGNRFFLSGATTLVCWLCILVGVSIYTSRYANHDGTLYHHGYSYILAWICFCFSFIIGVVYLVLRKK
uniref:Epithelial membrane protein 1 n=1 Tax=Gorilla gorilla gorilla TaxID=9595 RepID=G3QEC5_GORGO